MLGVVLPPVAAAVIAPRELLPPSSFACPTLRRRNRRAVAAAAARGSRKWWSDDDGYFQEDEDYEEEEVEEDTFRSSFGAELFEEPWFSKVFKTFGYVLPVMLASMLLATGWKAFLMAMAIPLGQSAISFLLDVISGRRTSSRNGNGRTQAPFEDYNLDDNDDDLPNYSTDFATDGGGETRKQEGYQSWVSDAPPPAAATADGGGSSASKSSNSEGDGRGFGGWDELLDDESRTQRKETKKMATAAGGQGQGRRRMSRSSIMYRQAPLVMRLLVAVFPFLGSWFRLL